MEYARLIAKGTSEVVGPNLATLVHRATWKNYWVQCPLTETTGTPQMTRQPSLYCPQSLCIRIILS